MLRPQLVRPSFVVSGTCCVRRMVSGLFGRYLSLVYLSLHQPGLFHSFFISSFSGCCCSHCWPFGNMEMVSIHTAQSTLSFSNVFKV